MLPVTDRGVTEPDQVHDQAGCEEEREEDEDQQSLRNRGGAVSPLHAAPEAGDRSLIILDGNEENRARVPEWDQGVPNRAPQVACVMKRSVRVGNVAGSERSHVRAVQDEPALDGPLGIIRKAPSLQFPRALHGKLVVVERMDVGAPPAGR